MTRKAALLPSLLGNEMRKRTSVGNMMPSFLFSHVSQRTYLLASISIASVVVIGALLYQTRAPLARVLGYAPTASASSPNTVYLSGNAAAASTTPQSRTQEVHIAGSGLVLLRGARVLSVSGNTIEVGMTWGSSEFKWSVHTNFSTKFLDRDGEKASVTNIHIGDVITVTGNVTQSGVRPVIDADIVRN